MGVFILGGDYLGNISKKLTNMGFNNIHHVKGRKKFRKSDLRIPQKTSLVIILTDYIDHNTTCIIKEQARTKNIPVVYAKRSWSHISQKLSTAPQN